MGGEAIDPWSWVRRLDGSLPSRASVFTLGRVEESMA